jgi:hypothetical protein
MRKLSVFTVALLPHLGVTNQVIGHNFAFSAKLLPSLTSFQNTILSLQLTTNGLESEFPISFALG